MIDNKLADKLLHIIKTDINIYNNLIEKKYDEREQLDEDVIIESNSKMALYNLTIAVGQVYLVTKGIKPSRHFKISQLKNYFGMNGGPEVFHSKLVNLQEVINQGVKNG